MASLTIIEQTDVHMDLAALLSTHEEVTTQSSGGQAKMCSIRREYAVNATSDLGDPTGDVVQRINHSDDTSAGVLHSAACSLSILTWSLFGVVPPLVS